jgi:HEAT repeat protein
MGISAKLAIPQLLPLLDDPSVEVQKQAALAVGYISPGDESIVPCLMPLLKHRNQEVRANAADAMGAKLPSIPLVDRRP